jgi:hypothetical protein
MVRGKRSNNWTRKYLLRPARQFFSRTGVAAELDIWGCCDIAKMLSLPMMANSLPESTKLANCIATDVIRYSPRNRRFVKCECREVRGHRHRPASATVHCVVGRVKAFYFGVVEQAALMRLASCFGSCHRLEMRQMMLGHPRPVMRTQFSVADPVRWSLGVVGGGRDNRSKP